MRAGAVTWREVSERPGVLCKRGGSQDPQAMPGCPCCGPPERRSWRRGPYPQEHSGSRFLGELGPGPWAASLWPWGILVPAGRGRGGGPCPLGAEAWMDQSGLGRSTAAPVPSAPSGLQLEVFFPRPLPLPLSWDGRGEERELNGRQDRRPGPSGTALLPRPFAACWHPPPLFLLSGGHETLKGHQGLGDTVVNPRVWPEPASSPSCPHPTPHGPARQPTCSDTCGRFSGA